LTGSARASDLFPFLRLFSIDRGADLARFDSFGELGDGGNSGFQAVNVAAQFGGTRIALVGFDMSLERGFHFHGRHKGPLNNPREAHLGRWRRAFAQAAPVYEAAGVEIVNTSEHSRLDAFPKMTLEAFLSCSRH